MKSNKEFDIAIVGVGIIGLAHAYFAAQQGLKVAVFEQNPRALGASIRNFGLIWPIGQDVSKLERAMRSRNTWLNLSEKAGFWVNNNGSLHLAHHQDEWSVLNEFQEKHGAMYNSELLDSNKAYSHSGFIADNELKGALWSPNEMTVNSREALPQITSYLEEVLGVALYFDTLVQKVENNLVHCFSEQTFKAQHIIVTGGSDVNTLYPELFSDGKLVRTKLQMLKAKHAQKNTPLGPTLCGGLTLTHYKAFESCNSLQRLNKRINEEHPDLKGYGIHVMVSQNNIGEFIIGDSHEYINEVTPFNKEAIDKAILKYLKHFFNMENLEITERWFGVYAKHTGGETELVFNPEKDVTIVNGLGGAGMTLSFGLAEEIINGL